MYSNILIQKQFVVIFIRDSPKKSGTNSGTSGFKFPSSLACSVFVLLAAFKLFGSDSGGTDAFIGIRKFRGVGGGGTQESVADAMIGTTGIP